MSHYRDKTLFIDIGNSAIKWSIDGQNYTSIIDDFSVEMLPKADNVWVSCVANCEILDGLSNINIATTDFKFGPLECGYKNPNELGIDRYLAMIAATDLYKNQNLLVVDVGSAVTFDVVLSTGLHKGGLIMPGLMAIRNSFAKFSTNNSDIQTKKLTQNSADAWLSGTSFMLLNSIERQIYSYKDKYKNITVIVTGGGAEKVLEYLSFNTHYHKNLVLDGLCIYAETLNNAH